MPLNALCFRKGKNTIIYPRKIARIGRRLWGGKEYTAAAAGFETYWCVCDSTEPMEVCGKKKREALVCPVYSSENVTFVLFCPTSASLFGGICYLSQPPRYSSGIPLTELGLVGSLAAAVASSIAAAVVVVVGIACFRRGKNAKKRRRRAINIYRD